MHRIEIPAINYKSEFAGKWEELTPRQVLYACYLLELVQAKELHPIAFKKLMIDRLLNRVNKAKKVTPIDVLEGKIGKKNADDVLNYWANEAKLTEAMDFFFKIKKEKEGTEDENVSYEIYPEFTDNLLPYVKIGRLHYGPAGMLSNLTLAEMKECIVCCDDGLHNRLAAILYRPRKRWLWLKKLTGKYDGNDREEFKPFDLDRKEKQMAKIPGMGFYCYLFFNSVLNYIYSQPLKIDGKEYNFSVLIKNDNPDSDNQRSDETESLGFTGVMYALAETGIFGDIEKTAKANIYDVFVSLYRGWLMNKNMKSI